MKIYKHLHDEPHYHLGSDQYNEPTGQNKIFEKIIRNLKQQLPEELHLEDEEGEYSVTVRDDRHRTYLYLNCYKYKNKKWRVKIIPYERGKGFFKEAFKPLIEKL